MEEWDFYDYLNAGADCLAEDWYEFTEGLDVLSGEDLESIRDPVLVTHGLLRKLDCGVGIRFGVA